MSTTQIYEQHYRRLDASIPLRGQRWIPIAREGLKALVSFRAYLGLIAIAWLPTFGRLVQVYFTTRFPEARRIAPIDDKFFFDFLSTADPAVDAPHVRLRRRRSHRERHADGGLLLYLSRPLTLGDYIFGKVAILLASLSMVTLIPGILSSSWEPDRSPPTCSAPPSHLILIPKIIALSLVFILPATGLVLVMSALARNPRFAGLGFFFIFAGSSVAQAIAWRATRSPYAGLISIQATMRRAGEAIFAVKPARMTADLPPELAIVTLVAMCLVCLAVLKTRVRAVEIVK
jgi:hypothetical protein